MLYITSKMEIYKKQLIQFCIHPISENESVTGKNIYKDYFSYTAGISLTESKSFGKQFSLGW